MRLCGGITIGMRWTVGTVGRGPGKRSMVHGYWDDIYAWASNIGTITLISADVLVSKIEYPRSEGAHPDAEDRHILCVDSGFAQPQC